MFNLPQHDNWKELLLKFNFQNIYSDTIRQHEETVKKVLSQKATPLITLLSNPIFWNDLKRQGNYDSKIEAVELLWKQNRRYIHLNVKHIINVIQNNIVPLENAYQRACRELQFDQEKCANNLQWRPLWYRKLVDIKIASLIKRTQDLHKLKNNLCKQLILRCEVHQSLSCARQCDDMLALISNTINNFNILIIPLDISQPYSATLDDDTRTAIYDLTQNGAVLTPIPQRGVKELELKTNVKRQLQEVADYSEKVIQQLHLEVQKKYPSFFKWVDNQLRSKTKALLFNFAGIHYLPGWTFIITCALFLASFLSYTILLNALTPILTIALGPASITSVSQALFYTVALAPLWWQMGKLLFSSEALIQKVLFHRKRNEIKQSLFQLQQTQTFIANKISQPIIDIAHYDIHSLQTVVDEHIKNIDDAIRKINRFYLLERWFCGAMMLNNINEIQRRLLAQKQQIKEHLYLLSKNIATRIGTEITMLQCDYGQNSETPITCPQQIHDLLAFVKTNSNKTITHLFLRNSNIINKWLIAINKNGLIFENNNDKNFNHPWGNSILRQDTLAGWSIFIKTFSLNEIEKNAALTINALLLNEKNLSNQELSDCVYLLGNVKTGNKIMQAIQKMLFNTLVNRNPAHAQLLSESQKQKLHQWYILYKDCIRDYTKALYVTFLKNPERKTRLPLESYLTLFENEAIYSFALGETEVQKERLQRVREFFNRYHGQHSIVYLLLRLLPLKEQTTMLETIAIRRLEWILSNIGKNVNPHRPFDDNDLQLFHDSRLFFSPRFDFTRIVMQSPRFHEGSATMQAFLGACQHELLGSKMLYERILPPVQIRIKQECVKTELEPQRGYQYAH